MLQSTGAQKLHERFGPLSFYGAYLSFCGEIFATARALGPVSVTSLTWQTSMMVWGTMR